MYPAADPINFKRGIALELCSKWPSIFRTIAHYLLFLVSLPRLTPYDIAEFSIYPFLFLFLVLLTLHLILLPIRYLFLCLLLLIIQPFLLNSFMFLIVRLVLLFALILYPRTYHSATRFIHILLPRSFFLSLSHSILLRPSFSIYTHLLTLKNIQQSTNISRELVIKCTVK